VFEFIHRSIQRKVVITVLLLVLLSVFSVGIVSYWMAFDYYRSVQQEKLDNAVKQIMYQYRSLIDQVKDGDVRETVAQERLLQYIHDFYPQEVKIFINDTNLINYVIREHQVDSPFTQVLSTKQELPAWSWTIHVSTLVNPFSDLFTDIQKSTIIMMVIMSIVGTELSIIFSHHLTKPVRQLVHFSKKVKQGFYPKPTGIKRNDEIGILAETFEGMVYRLKENEKRLQEMWQLNEQVLESIPLGIFSLYKLENRDQYLNKAARDMLNDNDSKALYQELVRVSTLAWEQKQEISHTFRQNERVLDIRACLLGNGLGTICIFEDITEQEAFIKKMGHLDKLASIGELAAGMAHEIRNPLTGIKTSVQVLVRRIRVKDNNVEGLVQRIVREIDRLNDLVQNLLQYARPQEISITRISVSQVVNETLVLVKKILNEEEISIHLTGSDKLTITFDEDHLKQIILNLLLNAIKAVSDKEVTGEICIKWDEAGLEVKDNGCGMTTEEINRCFDPFYTTNPKGSGLGLAVAYRLVKDNGADISVRSQQGKGSNFVIKWGASNEEANFSC